MRNQLFQRFRINKTVGYHDVTDSLFRSQFGSIEHVFVKRDGFRIGVGNRSTVAFNTALHHVGRHQVHIAGFRRTGLGDFPVLAVQTGEIASCSGNGKCPGLRHEMEEGLFFDRVDVNGAGISVSHGIEFVAFVDTVTAGALLTGFQGAFIGADAALHPPGRHRVKVGFGGEFSGILTCRGDHGEARTGQTGRTGSS